MDENTLRTIRELAGEFGVRKLVLFGSALSSFDSARDIDIACEGLTGRKFLRFGAKLEDLFNKSVDLIQLEEKSKLIDEIMKKGEILYES